MVYPIKLKSRHVVAALLLLNSNTLFATELIYTPVNPAFGGNPNNGPVLLTTAQAQNRFKDPELDKLDEEQKTSELQQFNQSLQRSILSRLSSAATSSLIGANGQLVPGTVDTGDFRIVIADLGGGVLQVTTTDKISGESVSFQVGNP